MLFEDFLGLRALTEPNVVPYGRLVDNILLRHVFGAVLFPESVTRNRGSHTLNIMLRAIAATVACDLGSDYPLPKLRN